jgi:putative endonuclease
VYYVYFLKSKKYPDKIYIGFTKNLQNRFKLHNSRLVPSTKPFTPWELIYYEAHKLKKTAKRREKYLKTTAGRRTLKIVLKDIL